MSNIARGDGQEDNVPKQSAALALRHTLSTTGMQHYLLCFSYVRQLAQKISTHACCT